MKRLAALIGCILYLAVAPAPARAQWYSRTEAIMDTRIYVELWDTHPQHANAAIDAVMAEMHHVDDVMSDFKPDSELSQINEHAARRPVVVSRELYDLIKLSKHYSQITDGAFDITMESVWRLYHFRQHIHPTDAQIKALLPTVGWRQLILDDRHHSVRFARPGMAIGLGGIAKGYVVDRSIAILQARGIKHAIVTAGGDSRILGDRRGRPWMVAILDPWDQSKVVTEIPITNEAISTSGDYYRGFVQNGVRYDHILSPFTGHSAQLVRSASVIAPTATETDGMSKTAFVLGPEKTLAIINRMAQYDAVFIDTEGRVIYSNGLAPPPGAPPPAPAPESPLAVGRSASGQ
ncbi:MAG TPA: FAD:protein FMN transferase [Steroidobacteraceae bacterium]|jgi:thiamine biosynthesis lipoprotein|nr:FAD:protein FMN transferase [Steroidobacteraceae bacterium]